MLKSSTIGNGRYFKVLVFSCLILTLMGGLGIWFWQKKRAETHTLPQKPVTLPEKTDPADWKPVESTEKEVDYDRLETDADYRDMMDKRKKRFGVEKSMDMVIRSDETIRVGKVVVPMSEILDKIRLKDPDAFIEKDLKDGKDTREDRERLFSELARTEKSFKALERKLEDPEVMERPEVFSSTLSEYIELRDLVADFEAYRETEKNIRENEALLSESPEERTARLREETEVLRNRMDVMEKKWYGDLYPDAGSSAEPLAKARKDDLFIAMDEIEKRLMAVEEELTRTEPSVFVDSPEKYGKLTDEWKTKRVLVDEYRAYRSMEKILDEKMDILGGGEAAPESIRQKIEDGNIRKNLLEHELQIRRRGGGQREIYGVYMVRPGDNIWNIHFNFLKEYFEGRSVRLSSVDDEPDSQGTSSGVGKILKFSEKMVYIYNIREKKPEVDLNLIHPLSKIVVFDMGKALMLLERIDFYHIDHIRFDGETLWIPARE